LLIPVAVVGVSAAASWLAVRAARRPLRVMVLGHSGSGKTTLIRQWRGEWAPGSLPTPDPVKIANIELDTGRKVLTVEKKFILRKVVDFSGQDESLRTVRDEVAAATAVVYLMHAKRLCEEERRPRGRGHTADWVRLIDDAYRLNRYFPADERVVLAVTHTDLDPRVVELGAAGYQARITAQLAEVSSIIGNPARVKLVAGHLATEDGAAALSERIIAGL